MLVGESMILDSLAELATISPSPSLASGEHGLLALLPFRQVRERGFDCVDDGEVLQAIKVSRSALIPAGELFERLPDKPVALQDEGYDRSDEAYAAVARKIIEDEIGGGAGANFVLQRSFRARIAEFDNLKALSVFRHLMKLATGAYWTFIVHTGNRTFVGASPERHVSLSNGVATMNPISGTYRYSSTGPTLDGLRSFLSDRKERDELYMVVDEELKMMARVCHTGGTIVGPTIKPMAKVAHTEYHINGACCLRPDEILRETLFAPTITGSPLENACRVIKKYEPEGRGYYSGVLALIGQDINGGHALDSSIFIRTADIDSQGHLRIGVGSTLVRDSDPLLEAVETKAKAAGVLMALQSGEERAAACAANATCAFEQFAQFERDPGVREALASRNREISPFWLNDYRQRIKPRFELAGLSALIIDAEDTFTSMIRHQVESLGLLVTLQKYNEPPDLDQFDIVIMGPGPGDPCDMHDPRIAALDETIGHLLMERHPFLGVCLSHQILSRKLGLPLKRRPRPNQGTRLEIDLFGTKELVGFYNSFHATSDAGSFIRSRCSRGTAIKSSVRFSSVLLDGTHRSATSG
ncbi:anthranilate synthase family protein [Agrobacterium vitis]|uniref:anthranilate synthase family protein n=1 Tax=Agrobacterium vitis TaxID=373 RepID=UPI003D264D0C